MKDRMFRPEPSLAAHLFHSRWAPEPGGDKASEPLVGAAVLVATAFRLRDEDGLIAALRHLVAAVDTMERRDLSS